MNRAAAVQQPQSRSPSSAEVLRFPAQPKKTKPSREQKLVKIGGVMVSTMGIREKTSLRTGRPVFEVQLREGKKVVFFKGGVESIEEAVRLRDDALKAKNQPKKPGMPTVNGALTMGGKRNDNGELIEPGLFHLYISGMEERGKKLPEKTIKRYEQFALHPVMAKATVADLGPKLMVSYCEHRKNFHKIKSSSLGTEFGFIGRAVKMVARWNEWNGFAPLTGVRSLLRDEKLVKSTGKGRPQMPTMAQFKMLIDFYEAHDTRAWARKCGQKSAVRQADILKWSGLQGTRAGETFELKLRDLREDTANGSATIGLWRKDSDADPMGEKRTRRRWEPAMPLVQEAYEVLKRQPSYIAWKSLTPAERMKSNLSVFRCGKHYTTVVLWAKARIECGLTDLHWHDLRARAITNLCKVMLPTRVKAYSGHRTLTALEIYVRAAEEDLQETAKLTASIKLPT